jgi:hypothetical protein
MKKIFIGISFAIILALTACGSHQASNYQDSTNTVPPAVDSPVKPADTPVQGKPDTAAKLDTIKRL